VARRQSATLGPVAVDVFGAGLVFLFVFERAFGHLFPNEQGRLGHDYAYFLPHLLAGRFFERTNGPFALSWFTPAFCGGLPEFANPQSAFYSLPQALSFGLDPLTSVHVSFLVFAWVGYAGAYLLARNGFALTRPAALLTAVLFMFNGFYAYRMVIGHLPFHAFMLTPLVAFFLVRSPSAVPVDVAIAGTLVAYMVYAGMVNGLAPVIATLVVVALWHALRRSARLSHLVGRGVAIAAVAAVVSAAKLAAGAAFLSSFPRADYPLPGTRTLLGAVRLLFGSVFFGPQHEAATTLLVNQQWTLERHEFEYGVTFVPLLVVLARLVVAARRPPRRAPQRTELALSLVIAAVLALPVFLNWYTPGWNRLLKTLPVLRSSSSMVRWFALYILPVALAAGVALDGLGLSLRARGVAAALGIAACLAVKLRADDVFYRAQPYDPTSVLEASARPGPPPPIEWIDDDGTGNDGLVAGISFATCYEPTFGYRLEHFPRKQLRAGPTLADVGGVLNVKNPACYAFPAENACAPGDHFTLAEADEARAFTRYERFPFAMSGMQRAANVITLVGLVGVAAVVATHVARRRR